jgi:hypothetical protein
MTRVRQNLGRFLLAALCLVAIRCGGASDSPTSPTSPTPPPPVENLVLVTLSGTVNDSVSSHRPIGGATVRVQNGINEGKRTQTDRFGRYTLGPLVAGAFMVSYEAGGSYTPQSHPIDIATDATWNVALDRAPSPF